MHGETSQQKYRAITAMLCGVLGNSVAGSLGLILQIAGFVAILLLCVPRYGVSRALVNAGVVSIYGYALIVSFMLLLAVPWQVTNVALGFSAATSLLAPGVRHRLVAGVAPFLQALRRGRVAVAMVIAILLLHIFVVAIIPELSVDGQLYHGPVLANIVQSGSLWGWDVPNQYAYYTDLTMAGGVNLATFTGDARFDAALQIPHLLLLIFLINWALSATIRFAFVRVALATLIVSAPVIWLQPRILYVDLAYGVAVAGAIFFIVLVHKFSRFDLIVLGMLVGAVFATTPTGILTGLVLGLGVVVVVAVRRRHVEYFGRTLLLLIGAFVPPVVLAMSAYLRNFVQFGNPVYLVQASFGPITLPGILDLSAFASGERGDGLIDPARLISFVKNIAVGATQGVSKLDYDPREGGFGYVPLVVVVIAVSLIALQVRARLRSTTVDHASQSTWRAQVGIVGIVAAILIVQPATFDARYVIGPIIALLTGLLMTSIAAFPPVSEMVAGCIATVIAVGQVGWTEQNMYPGINVALYLMHAPMSEQPNTLGNPWGRGVNVAWLPEGPDRCVTIALQTAGGVTPRGVEEASLLGALAYGLYGDQLCNRVFPVTLDGDGIPTKIDGLEGADYLVLYADDVDDWNLAFPGLAGCLAPVYSVPGSEEYPQRETVLLNTCT